MSRMHALMATLSGLLLLSGCAFDPCVLIGADNDNDGDGFICSEDCNDLSPAIFPGAYEACDGWDNDCDGAVPVDEFDPDGDGYRGCDGDCEPTNALVHPHANEFCDAWDNDCDSSTSAFPGENVDEDGDGWPLCADCEDQLATVNPGASEACDWTDTNCNGIADYGGIDRHLTVAASNEDGQNGSFLANGLQPTETVALTGFAQRILSFSSSWIAVPPRFVVLVREAGLGGWAEVATAPLFPADSGDWWRTETLSVTLEAGRNYRVGVATAGGSVRGAVEWNPAVLPGPFGPFVEYGTIMAPSDLSFVPYADLTPYPVRWAQSLIWRGATEIDQDGDTEPMCNDCDDAGAEICDGFDFDCDGQMAAGEVDLDGDGWLECAGDCDDATDTTEPHAVEICDGTDSNCLPEATDAEETDMDGDGWSPCEGDCDDLDPAAFPGATEACDSIDQDCDGDTEDWRVDGDLDGVWDCFDCDDDEVTVGQGLDEICDDGVDQDCDGEDATSTDYDQDGVSSCDGDCDDSEVSVFPGATDVDDGLDNDCDGDVDGLVPSVRVEFEVDQLTSVEGFWGPAGHRRPHLGGDLLVFTRTANGTIVDAETIEYPQQVRDEALGEFVPMLHANGDPVLTGSAWLEGLDAVQIVVAFTNPYIELEVSLLPATPAMAAVGARSVATGDCGQLDDYALDIPGALDLLKTSAFYEWIEFNDPDGSAIWSAEANCPGNAPDRCWQQPSLAAIKGACEGLKYSSAAVRSAVNRVDWGDLNGAGIAGKTKSAGTIMIDVGLVNSFEAGLATMSHEAAHAYTWYVNLNAYGAQPPTASPELAAYLGGLASVFGQSPPRIVEAFDALTTSAGGVSEITDQCVAEPYYNPALGPGQYAGNMGDAWDCGFLPASGAAAFYGKKNAHEDIATWAQGAVFEAYATATGSPLPSSLCDDVAMSLSTLEAERSLHYGKLVLLSMSGFLPESIADGCASDLMPDWNAHIDEIWTETSDPEYLFSEPASASRPPGQISITHNGGSIQPAEELTLHLESSALPQAGPFSGLVGMTETAAAGPFWLDDSLYTTSYFERLPPNFGTGSSVCEFSSYAGSIPATYGRSTGGVTLVITGPDWIWGVAVGMPWGCGWNPVLISDPSAAEEEDTEFGVGSGVPVFFRVATPGY
jgi:hypothetical protein